VPERAAREPVEWSVATRCRRGEATSGDLAVVTLLPEGALVAGIDGLGHGSEAARAARKAAEAVRENPTETSACSSSAATPPCGAHVARRSAWPSFPLRRAG